jgi:4-diphosphocytidyl-2-C-methyl-D-erythritol kinase
VATVYQRITLCDRVAIEPADALRVDGFADDTLVRAALERLAGSAGVEARWRARIWKRIPVAGGLGGGSTDAATALRLANATLSEPLAPGTLETLAAGLGADIPFFLRNGPQLGTGDGSQLAPLDLPQDYWIALVLDGEKPSTAAVYRAFDRRAGAAGFDERRALLLETLAGIRRPRDLAALPPNDLASSPLAGELRARGAFRADVTGAGPTVYGLFHHKAAAEAAVAAFAASGRRAWLAAPAWYV